MTLNGKSANAHDAATVAPTNGLTESVDVRVEAFLGDTLLTIGDLNRLKDNDVIPLSTTLADPVELRVNGVRIARGELVSVGDQFAVRIIEIA